MTVIDVAALNACIFCANKSVKILYLLLALYYFSQTFIVLNIFRGDLLINTFDT
jgi:hypothetical protein